MKRSANREGEFLSLHKIEKRSEAERSLAIMEYGNQVLFVTAFRVIANTPIWIGRVDPGDHAAKFGNTAGSQVFLEREYEGQLREIETKIITNDMNGYQVSKETSVVQ